MREANPCYLCGWSWGNELHNLTVFGDYTVCKAPRLCMIRWITNTRHDELASVRHTMIDARVQRRKGSKPRE
jgi:hypothetical protein